MFFKAILVVVISAWTAISHAQSSCECSHKEQALATFDSLRVAKKMDEVKLHAQSLLSNSQPGCHALGHEFLAFYYQRQKDWNLSNKELDTQFHLLKSNGCEEGQFLGNHYLRAVGYFNNSSFDSAFVYFINCLEIAERTGDEDYQIKSLTNLGAVLNRMKQSGKSAFYLKKAAIIADQKQDLKLQTQIYANLASNYHSLYNDSGNINFSDSSFYFANKGMQAARITENFNVMYRCYNFLGHYYQLRGDNLRAILYTDSVIHAKSPPAESHPLCYAFELRSMAHEGLGQHREALQFADSCYYYSLQTETLNARINALKQISSNGKKLGLFERALLATEELKQIEDSVSNAETIARIEELEQKYNKAQNEKTIRELSQEGEIKSLNIKLLAAGIALALVLIAIIIIAFRQRELKNNQRLTEAEQRLNRARMNPHFFFNTLASLQTFALQSKDIKLTSLYLAKYARIMRQTLESTYEELHSLDEEKEFLDHYLELQQLRQPGKFTFEVHFENIENPTELLLPTMLLQPFLENSIEHGFQSKSSGGKIDISFKNVSNQLHIEIKDNGEKVMNQVAKDHISRATQIIRDRLVLLNKSFRKTAGFESTDNLQNGYGVKITLPLIVQK
jgi:hypothetical protein